MMQMCNYRAMLGLLALVCPSGKDFKTQGNLGVFTLSIY